MTAVTVGAAMYVNWSEVLVALVAPAVVTVTSTGPALRSAGEVAVIEVDELTLKTAAAVPKLTALALGSRSREAGAGDGHGVPAGGRPRG